MVGANAAVNLLLDAVVWIRGTQNGDDGDPVRTPIAGNGIIFKADRVVVRTPRTSSDHGTAQDTPEFHRTGKIPQEIDIETKLQFKTNAELNALLLALSGVVVQFILSAKGANWRTLNAPNGSPAGGAYVEDLQYEYGSPSTLRFRLKQYGTMFEPSAGAAYSVPS